MNAFGVVSYGAALAAHLLLALLLVTNWRRRQIAAGLIAVALLTAAWAGVSILQNALDYVPAWLVYVAEVARAAAWFVALTMAAGTAAPRRLVLLGRIVCIALLAAVVVLFIAGRGGAPLIDPTLLLARAGLVLSVLNLVLLEQIVRNAPESARPAIKYFALGVAMALTYDLFLYSQIEMMQGVSLAAWNARGLVNAAAVPLIVWASRSNSQWSIDIFISRQAVFYTTTFLVVGVYLTVMAAGGYFVRERGGTWGTVGQVAFFTGAGIVLVCLLSSSALRRYARVFISKHFYRNKYDYRLEWLRFVRTLSSSEDDDVRRTALQATAQIFSSPGGVIFLRDDTGRDYVPAAAWPLPLESLDGLDAVAAGADLPLFLVRTQWIIDLREYQREPEMYGNIVLPQWLVNTPGFRLVTPLLQVDSLLGFMVLYDPPPPFELTYEDRDLLKMVGRHIATHIAQHDAHRKLAEARQFEAYNRLTSFMMHDLKNSVAQLQLIVANADRHKRNPQFVDDAIATIGNAVERMNRLIAQLRGGATADRTGAVEVADVVRTVAARCADRVPAPVVQIEASARVRADPERLATTIEHVVRNAQDATGERGGITLAVRRAGDSVEVSVIDTGAGMTREFVRERLFRPFDSTKGSKGMGIGAYQVREYVRSLGGSVEVQSSPGQGTRFSISLPVLDSAQPVAAGAALEA